MDSKIGSGLIFGSMNAHFLVTWVEKLQIYAAGVRMQAGVSL